MSLGVTKTVIVDGAKELKRAWLATRDYWDDEMARKFEEEFLEPIGPRLTEAVKALEHLQGVCRKAEMECEDNGE